MTRFGPKTARLMLKEVTSQIEEARKAMKAAGLPERILTVARGRRLTLVQMARHEAAHAVLALALGGLVWFVCVEHLDLAGTFLFDGWAVVTFRRRSPARVAAVAVAGTVAVRGTFSPLDARLFFRAGQAGARGASPDAYFSRAKDKARHLLSRYAEAVDRVADVLVERRALTGAQIRRLLRRRWPDLRGHEPVRSERAVAAEAGFTPEKIRRHWLRARANRRAG